MAHYVQFLNVGYGGFLNTKMIEKWDVEEALEEAMLLDNPAMDIRIIGFRFYEKKGDQIVQKSGVYYLSGEVVCEPSKDETIVNYFQKVNKTIPQFPVVKITKPYFMIYPYHKGDCMVERPVGISKEKLRSKKERMMKLRNQVETYKKSLVEELYFVAEAIESEQFSRIPLVAMEGQKERLFLNLAQDKGDFGIHIRTLQQYIQELESLQKPIE